jgi:hypothetical protein
MTQCSGTNAPPILTPLEPLARMPSVASPPQSGRISMLLRGTMKTTWSLVPSTMTLPMKCVQYGTPEA